MDLLRPFAKLYNKSAYLISSVLPQSEWQVTHATLGLNRHFFVYGGNMDDVLRMDYINSLPQPFTVTDLGNWEWPVYDIEVQTGLYRIDVCGKLQVCSMPDAKYFTDSNGVKHDPDTFYSDYEETTNE